MQILVQEGWAGAWGPLHFYKAPGNAHAVGSQAHFDSQGPVMAARHDRAPEPPVQLVYSYMFQRL